MKTTTTAMTLIFSLLVLLAPGLIPGGATAEPTPVVTAAAVARVNDTGDVLPSERRSGAPSQQAGLAQNAAEIQQLAETFAPLLRFDSKQGDKNKCFPSDAGQYYEKRRRGEKGRVCNTDYDSIERGDVPVYYQYAACGDDQYVSYWFFYGWQDTCSPGEGEHPADWERVVVKIRPGNTRDRVMFFQHKGQYTKTRNHYKTYENTHPVVYVGKNSHGSYHDDGGSGTCCYWEDFRNPGKPNQKMQTWKNLVRLSKEPGSPEWMRYDGTKYWDGLTGPLFRKRDSDLCNLQGCRGSHLKVCHTGGCYKSDIGDKDM